MEHEELNEEFQEIRRDFIAKIMIDCQNNKIQSPLESSEEKNDAEALAAVNTEAEVEAEAQSQAEADEAVNTEAEVEAEANTEAEADAEEKTKAEVDAEADTEDKTK